MLLSVFKYRCYFVIILVFFSYPIWGSIFQVSLDSYHLAHVPLFYKDSVFGILKSNTNVIQKKSLQGAVLWTYSLPSNIQQLHAHFDILFVRDDQGTLFALDIKQGYQRWVLKGRDIIDSKIQYPYIIYRSKSQKIGSVSFDEGQVFWETDVSPNVDVSFIGHSGKIGLLTNSQLKFFNLVDGQLIKTVSLLYPANRIQTHWHNGLVLESDTQLQRVDIGKRNSVVPISLQTLQPLWVQEKYYISYLPTQSVITVTNILHNQPIRSISVSPNIVNISVSNRHVLLQYTPSHNRLLSWELSETSSQVVALPTGNVSVFHHYNNSAAFIIGDTLIYSNLDDKK